MNEIYLFIDGSVNTKTKVGFGAYLLVEYLDTLIEDLKEHVKVKLFENTSSTKLELQNLLWAFSQIQLHGNKIIVFTDSQNIIGLNKRRERLEQNNYLSGKDKLLNNHALYKEFFDLIDKNTCEFRKVEGHKPSTLKIDIEKIFTLVDRASRNALREI